MAEENMPAIEADEVENVDERTHYEFAFHILPTIAEEEVPAVFGELKTLIDRAGGEITSEEAPQRFDLAYSMYQAVEGRRVRHDHSYFGWIRFKLEGEKLANLKGEIEHDSKLLRYLLIRLTRHESAHPFRVFDRERKESATERDAAPEGEKDPEVSEEALQRSLEEITA